MSGEFQYFVERIAEPFCGYLPIRIVPSWYGADMHEMLNPNIY